MATETQTPPDSRSVTGRQWTAGAVGGFVGSIAFGLMMLYVMPAPMLEVVIPAMYGVEGPALAVGWALHLFHGVVLGLAYVGVVQIGIIRETASTPQGSLTLGIAYGILTTIVLAVLVMPLWLQVVGFQGAPPFPNIAFPATAVSAIGHIVYAIPVALAYAVTIEG